MTQEAMREVMKSREEMIMTQAGKLKQVETN